MRLSILTEIDERLQKFERNRSLSNTIIYTAVLNELSGYQDTDDISCNQKQGLKKTTSTDSNKTNVETYVDALEKLSKKTEQALM